MNTRRIAVILGAGPGLSSSIATKLASTHSVVLLSRSLPGSLHKLGLPSSLSQQKDKLLALTSDGSKESIDQAFQAVREKWPDGKVDVGVYNVNEKFALASFLEKDESHLRSGLEHGVVGAWNFAQALIPLFLQNQALSPDDRDARGTLLFTGATMSLKAGAQFSALAPGMFARRALSQSLAREFGPQGVHVAHVVIDGIIDTPAVREWIGEDKDGKRLRSEEIAQVYVDLIEQKRSAWSSEIDVRPDVEKW